MKWVTRARPKTDRIACPWLIRKFIDPEAEILYAPAGDVLTVAQREDAPSFDAPGADYTHRGTQCTFEARHRSPLPAAGLPQHAPGEGGPPVSVKAISSALDVGPVPRDRGGKRNPACRRCWSGYLPSGLQPR